MRALALFLAIAAASASPAALSADASPARAAFEKGKAAFEDGDYARAADAFRRAHRLKPNWKLQYNIGQSEAAAKRHGLALQAFEAYLSAGGDDIPLERREEVLAEVRRLRAMVGYAKISAPAGAAVSIDGVERGRAPIRMEIPVAASVRHEASAVLEDGRALSPQAFQVTGGKTAEIELAAKPSTDAPAPPEAPSPPADAPPAAQSDVDRGASPLAVAGWISLAAGAGALAAGAATGGVALSKNRTLEDDCDASGVCFGQKNHDELDARDALATSSTVLLIAGGALAATGATLLIFGAAGGEGEPEVALAPGPLTLAIEGRF